MWLLTDPALDPVLGEAAGDGARGKAHHPPVGKTKATFCRVTFAACRAHSRAGTTVQPRAPSWRSSNTSMLLECLTRSASPYSITTALCGAKNRYRSKGTLFCAGC